MARLLVLLATLVLLAASGAGASAGEAADTAAVGVGADTVAAAPPGEPPFFSWAYWQEGGTNTSRSEVFRNFGLFFVAVIALGFGIWRAVTGYMQARASQRQAEAANAQARIAEQGNITERFSRAVEQLGHDTLTVRIGGLYALKRIGEDSVERDHLAVMDVLTNFIRQPPYTVKQDRADKIADGGAPHLELELIDCPDIVAAISIVRGGSEDQKAIEAERGYRLSLARANLSYLRLPEVNLMFFDLAGAHLRGAILTHSKLFRADLTGADLTGADLTEADLTAAYLTGANLMDAYLREADLTRANLTGTDLRSTDVTQDQLDSACISKGGTPPALPEGLKPPQKVCVP